jgi:hypothetical protein
VGHVAKPKNATTGVQPVECELLDAAKRSFDQILQIEQIDNSVGRDEQFVLFAIGNRSRSPVFV